MRTLLPLLALLTGCAAGAHPRSVVAPVNTAAREGVVLYTLQPGDSLLALAARFHVPGGAPALVNLNQIEQPDRVRAGRGILVPAQSPWTDGLPAYHPPAPSHEALRACARHEFAAPVSTSVQDCTRAWCASAGDDQVCTCERGDGTTAIVVRDHGTERARWPAVLAAPASPSLYVARADLDGEPGDELVVAWLSTLGGGLTLHGWGVAVLGEHMREPVTFAVNEFGPGTLIARENAARCDVLATEWTERRDAMLGPGLYLLARRYEYTRGTLRALPAHPLARRLLQDLAEAVSAAPLGQPEVWLGAERAEVVGDDPVPGPGAAGVRTGVIESVDLGPTLAPGRTLAMTFGSAQGTTLALQTSAAVDATRLGDATTGMVWPRGYFPAELGAWRGHAASLREYEGVTSGRRAVLWIVDAH